MKSLFKKIVVAILTYESILVLKKHKPFIIGVTGNLGKTSTKDAIYAVMKDKFNVRKSQKSYNSFFGVPLTILNEKSGWNNPLKWAWIVIRGLFVPFERNYPEYLVLEVGADRVNDIKDVCKWLKSDITVVTQFGEVPVHIEFFKDKDAIIQEKGYLVEALNEDGLFIYNGDDLDSQKLLEKTNARKQSFSIKETGDARAFDIRGYGNIDGVEADVLIGDDKCHLVLPEVIGKSPVYCALPALLVAKELNIPLDVACASLRDADKPKGRMRLLKGMNDSIIIDDTYNASPKATEHGLKTLSTLDGHRKIAVLGDMMELGKYTKEEHHKIGMVAGKICHKLICVGIRSRETSEGALDAGMNEDNILECDNSILAGKELVEMIQPGDVIYVKGSQSMRMERAVKMILAENHLSQDVLVRQEKEWL